MAKKIDWAKFESIEFSARTVAAKASEASLTLANAMLFLCDVIQTLRAQNHTLQVKLDKIGKKP